MTPKIYVIVGPTASGKSAHAVALAKRVGGEVISADSRQVYRGLDIGSGKITTREMEGVPHHMLDVADPKRIFTANDFVRRARPIIEDIITRGKVPIICGGTGFYIDALLGHVTLPDVPPNHELRARLAHKSASDLFAMLEKKDPRRASRIDRHNPVRLIRALEIVAALGVVPEKSSNPIRADIQWHGIDRTDADLKKRIHDRLLTRMKSGMAAEVRQLHLDGLSYRRMESLGLEYRHLSRYVRGLVTRKQMLEELERDIREYAKRQRTYWRRNRDIAWIRPGTRQ